MKAVKVGSERFEMVYVRPWEVKKDELYAAKNAGHHIITINVVKPE